MIHQSTIYLNVIFGLVIAIIAYIFFKKLVLFRKDPDRINWIKLLALILLILCIMIFNITINFIGYCNGFIKGFSAIMKTGLGDLTVLIGGFYELFSNLKLISIFTFFETLLFSVMLVFLITTKEKD